MPKYVVTAPDGQRYEVNAPDGASEAEVMAYAQQNYQNAAPKSSRRFGGIPVEQEAGGSRFGGVPIDPSEVDWDEPPPPRTRKLSEVTGAGPWTKYQDQNGDAGSGPWTKYSEEQLIGALRKADAAGDTPAAKAIARRIRAGRASTKADFSDVVTGSSTVHTPQWATPAHVVNARPYSGPLLRESPRPYIPSTPANRAARAEMERRQALPTLTPAQAKQRAFQELPMPVRFAIGAGSRVGAAGRGAGQLYAQAADAVAPRQYKLSDLVRGTQSRYDQAMAREAQARADDGYMQGDTAAMLGGIAGDIGLLAAPGGAVTRVVGTTGKAALVGNVALSAGYAGMQPVIQGESRGQNTVAGAAFGAGAHGVSAGLRAAGNRASNAVAPEVREMARRAHELGIPLHASQVSQSLPVKVAASAGKYLPFSGYAKAASRQQEGLNRAVGRTFGADASKLTDDVMQQGRRRLSAQFEEIYNRNAVAIGEKGARKLAEIEREASRRLTNDEAQVLRNQFDDILANAEDGVLSGQKYQAVRTAMKKAEGNDKLGIAVREMRVALDDIASDAVGPQDAAALKGLRSSWANMRTTEKALQQAAGAGGDIRATSLWPLIRNGSTKEMREIARMGQTLLRDPIADSGTAQRTLIYNLLMGSGSIANPALIPLIGKAAAGGATIGRAANSNALARMITRENRGVPTSRLAELLGAANPYVAPAAAAEANRRKQTNVHK